MSQAAFLRRIKLVTVLGGAVCTLGGGVILWKDMMSGEKYLASKSATKSAAADADDAAAPVPLNEWEKALEGQVYVVTGANSGIGKVLTHELARRKCRVYMACRDMRKCEEVRREVALDTHNKYVYCRKCDLSSFASVRKFAEQLKSKEPRVHGLVNNAGVMNCPRSFSADGIEMQLAVNHFGHALLTHLLLPALRPKHVKEDPHGRVVFLVNLDYRKGSLNFDDLNLQKQYSQKEAFRQSQLANMLFVHALTVAGNTTLGPPGQSGVTVNAVYPGITSTNIKRHMTVDKSVVGTFLSNPLLWFLSQKVERGAQTPLFATIDPSLEQETGKLYANLKEMPIKDVARDGEAARRLLAVGKYWTGLVESKEQLLKEVAPTLTTDAADAKEQLDAPAGLSPSSMTDEVAERKGQIPEEDVIVAFSAETVAEES